MLHGILGSYGFSPNLPVSSPFPAMFVAALLTSSALAFAPGLALAPSSASRHSPVVALESRRAALASGAGLLAAAAIAPLSAHADSLEEIAARSNAAAMEDRKKAEAQYDQVVTTEEKVAPIAGVAIAGVALSVPFFFQNLQRLGTKVASGGQDSGYARKGGKTLAKQVGMSFFKKNIDI